ncbi:MAG: hypothetical protein HKN44_12215 [Ilumatobacter sp.]|nr:hypothetical protein [Ilumatobacter sp.]
MATDDNGTDGETPAEVAQRRTAATSAFRDGASIGPSTLPHRDPVASAAFALAEFELVSVPALPNLSGGSVGLAQAAAGVPGVTVVDGRLSTDSGLLAGSARLAADLDDQSYVGLRALLELSATIGIDGAPIVWHHVGPITLGAALHRAGLDIDIAFPLAIRVVRTQLVEIADAIAAALPTSEQLVLLDEPRLADLMSPDFPIPPDHAIDLMSTGMAALDSRTMVGIQCDRPCDIATMLASGPGVIAVPVDGALVEWAGYLSRFHEDGGVVAWGVVPNDGPVAFSADRYWRELSDLWCELVRRGCDPVALRRQALVAPGGGLDHHSVSVARRIARLTVDVSRRVKDQANATRFALGA